MLISVQGPGAGLAHLLVEGMAREGSGLLPSSCWEPLEEISHTGSSKGKECLTSFLFFFLINHFFFFSGAEIHMKLKCNFHSR